MKRVGVLYGGRSGEHDVSLCSAASVVENLNRDKYEVIAIGIDRTGKWHVQEKPEIIEDHDFGKILKLEKTGEWQLNHFERENRLYMTEAGTGKEVWVDIIFPVVHGTFCEDGTLQGLLELAMVPYVGADVYGSAVGMDKDIAKRLLRDAGIPVVPWEVVSIEEWKEDRTAVIGRFEEKLNLPYFVKPVCAGSSVGVYKVEKSSDAIKIISESFKYDVKVMAEKAIDAREIECAVLGNRRPESSVPGEVIPNHEFYSYESKYIDPDGASLEIPAKIDDDVMSLIRKTAVEGYRALCCSGMARVDFFLSKSTGEIYLNEINTLPGFTSISMYPKLWDYSGLKYEALLEKLIELAMERFLEKKLISTDWSV